MIRPLPIPDPVDQPDGALAASFAAGPSATRDAAFAELVRRHAPMVLATCRRIAGGDGEDAAQAVFLTLAQKAGDLGSYHSLGGWLHRVACHVGWRCRDAAAARRRNERAAVADAPTHGVDGDRDLRELLDRALDRLAPRYRVPLVLHYLEGEAQDAVARRLGLREGTLASLLSRGRSLLRAQVERAAGGPVGAGALMSVLTATCASATEPLAPFAATLIHAADLAAAGRAAAELPHHIAHLSAGALRAMTIAKIKFAAGVAAAVLVFAGTIGGVATARAGEAPPPAPAPLPAPAPVVADPADLINARLAALRANDVAALLATLSPEQRARLNEGWGQAQAPNRMRDAVLGGQLAAAAGPDGGKHFAALLKLVLEQIRYRALEGRPERGAPPEVAPTPAPAEGGQPDRAQMMAQMTARFLPGMIASNLMSAPIAGILAEGLETRQSAAWTSLMDAFADWIPSAGFDDQVKVDAAGTQLAAAFAALGAKTPQELTALSIDEITARLTASMPALKQALTPFGVDLDAVLASAKASSEAGAGDTRTVVLAFTAFGKPQSLPIKMLRRSGTWEIAGDSPLARWLRQTGGGMRGGPPGGRPQGRRQRGDGAPAPAPEGPVAPPPAGNSF